MVLPDLGGLTISIVGGTSVNVFVFAKCLSKTASKILPNGPSPIIIIPK
jgi:hypothetical protein